MKRVFFVGFDDPDPSSEATLNKRLLKLLCIKYGLTALFPPDVSDLQEEIGEVLNDPSEVMVMLFRSTIMKLTSADTVIININIFDSTCSNDTAFLIGYASAKGKRIIGYLDAERASESMHTSMSAKQNPTPKGTETHNACKPTNHMIACATSFNIQSDIEDCLQYLFDSPTDDNLAEG